MYKESLRCMRGEDFPDLPEICYFNKNLQAWPGCPQFVISDYVCKQPDCRTSEPQATPFISTAGIANTKSIPDCENMGLLTMSQNSLVKTRLF